MSILIRNGWVITEDCRADVYVEKETIAAIGESLDMPADLVIDAAGKYVIPGGVDVHTHLDMPLAGITTSDDFATGTRAAAFGGTTCVIDFAVQSRGMRMREALDAWLDKGKKATIDFGLHMIVTDLPEARLDDLDAMAQEGVTSFKLFMAYPDSLMSDDATILRAMRRARRCGSLCMVHAENGTVIDFLVREAIASGKTAPVFHALTRPAAAEVEAVDRAIGLAQMADAPVYVVHVSSADALRRIEEAVAGGQRVFAETCPQYLLLSLEDLARPDLEGAKYVYSPPAREKRNQADLWRGLSSGALQLVSTDHCPVLWRDKLAGALRSFAEIPNGGPGIENRMQLLFHYGVNSGRITPKRWVEITATEPARIFGLYPRKGAIAEGSDADLVIWDPEREHTISASTHHMRVDYSLFEGFRVRGNADTVLSRGEVILRGGEWLGRPGRGRFIRRSQVTWDRR